MSKKQFYSFMFNLVIVVFGLQGAILAFMADGAMQLKYYTMDSNLFAISVSIIYLIAFIVCKNRKIDIPEWVYQLRLYATVCLMVTFLVVVFVLAPFFNPHGHIKLMFAGSQFHQHTLCPLASFISFIFFERGRRVVINRRNCLNAVGFTFLYAIIAIILNILGLLEGPYPFLLVTRQPVSETVMWFFVIVGGSYLLACFINRMQIDLYRLNQKCLLKRSR